ncbi:acyl carrier protein [Terasakiella pusilla]|uniref:acyl carrier protein n=1 Tax=Terasakiella pusilla TaxID=64973 RepID=UPI003AA8CDBD
MLNDVISCIRQINDQRKISDDTELFDDFLDSFDLLTLVGLLEDKFNVEIPGEEMDETNFRTPASIALMLNKIRGGT